MVYFSPKCNALVQLPRENFHTVLKYNGTSKFVIVYLFSKLNTIILLQSDPSLTKN